MHCWVTGAAWAAAPLQGSWYPSLARYWSPRTCSWSVLSSVLVAMRRTSLHGAPVVQGRDCQDGRPGWTLRSKHVPGESLLGWEVAAYSRSRGGRLEGPGDGAGGRPRLSKDPMLPWRGTGRALLRVTLSGPCLHWEEARRATGQSLLPVDRRAGQPPRWQADS